MGVNEDLDARDAALCKCGDLPHPECPLHGVGSELGHQDQQDGGVISELEEQIQVVREARNRFSVEKSSLDAARFVWEEGNRSQIELVDSIKVALQAEENKLREMTIGVYFWTKNKKPAPGVGIRLVKIFNYDTEKAKSWAVEHNFTNLLDLNAAKFKKAAEGLSLDFVDVEEKPTATIAEVL